MEIITKMTRDDIIIEYGYENFLFADGYDEAILGVDENQFGDDVRVVYSVKKIIDILINRDGMDCDQAREFFDHNVAGSYVGKKTPVWCVDDF